MKQGRLTSAKRDQLRSAVSRGKPPCHICGGAIDYALDWRDPGAYQIDHIIPLSRGGANDLSNLGASHRDCNRRKWDRPLPPPPITEWATSRAWW